MDWQVEDSNTHKHIDSRRRSTSLITLCFDIFNLNMGYLLAWFLVKCVISGVYIQGVQEKLFFKCYQSLSSVGKQLSKDFSVVYSHSYWLAVFWTTNSSPVMLARVRSINQFRKCWEKKLFFFHKQTVCMLRVLCFCVFWITFVSCVVLCLVFLCTCTSIYCHLSCIFWLILFKYLSVGPFILGIVSSV